MMQIECRKAVKLQQRSIEAWDVIVRIALLTAHRFAGAILRSHLA